MFAFIFGPLPRLAAALCGSLAACLVAVGAAQEPVRLKPGETVRLSLPSGEESLGGLFLELTADRSGPTTIEARSLTFDTMLNVTRSGPDGTWQQVAEDDDGGAATNSRVMFDAEQGAIYRVRVRPIHVTYCPAQVEVQAIGGRSTTPADGAAEDEAYWKAAQERAAGQPGPHCAIELLIRRADAAGDGAPDERLRLAEEAYRRADEAFDDDHLLLASAAHVLGAALLDAQEYARARSALERAVAIRTSRFGEGHTEVATSLTRLGWALEGLEEIDQALRNYERAVRIHESQAEPDRIEIADNLYNAGSCLITLGRYGEARGHLERALQVREETVGSGDPSLAEDYKGLGEFFFMMGDYQRAERFFLQALDLLAKAPDAEPGDLGVVHSNLGVLYHRLNRYQDARSHLEQAVQFHERTEPSDRELATALHGLAHLHASMGLHDEAVRDYERAIALWESVEGKDCHDVGTALANRAALYLTMKRYDLSRADLTRALQILRKNLDPDHTELATSLINYAEMLERTGAAADARGIMVQVLPSLRERLGESHPSVARAEEILSGAEIRLGSFDEGGRLLESARTILLAQFGQDHPAVARVLDRLARLKAATGHRAEALEAALQAEEIGRHDLTLRIRPLTSAEALRYAAVRASGLDTALSLAGDPGGGARGIDRVFDALIRSRGLVLSEMAAGHRAAVGAGLVDALARAFAECSRRYSNLRAGPSEGVSPETHRRALEGARNECDDAERRLQETQAHTSDEPARVGLGEIRRRLPPGSALVSFVRYERFPHDAPGDLLSDPVGTYASFVIPSAMDDAVFVPLGAAATIDGAVARWRRAVEQPARRGMATPEMEKEARAHGEELRRLVWDPVAARLREKTERIFLVADGALNLVNLSALPAAETGWLIETAPPMHQLSTEQTLAQRQRTTAASGGILVVGDPRFDPDAGTTGAAGPARTQEGPCLDLRSVRFDALPATAEEARVVAALWEQAGASASSAGSTVQSERRGGGPAVLLTQARATEAAVKSEAPGKRILHLSTHGFFLEEGCALRAAGATRGIGSTTEAARPAPPPSDATSTSSWLAGLAFAGANRPAAADPQEENGILLAEEIATMDLTGVEWAVLSACQTAVGEVRPGEGVLGLRSAFQVAGAASLIMSLWSVEDTATREWMESLYEGRLVMNLDTAAAVHRASLNLLRARRERGDSAHPFFWGAFVATGDWR